MKRAISIGLRSVAALLAFGEVSEHELIAQIPACTAVGYLQQVPTGAPRFSKRQPTYAIPPDTSNGASSIAWVGAGTYPFTLPGYGPVYATVSPYPGVITGTTLANYVPELTWALPSAPLHGTTDDRTCMPPGTVNWGTDSNSLNFYNVANPGQPATGTTSYTITFDFDEISAPNPADLFLVVSGLADGTTATLKPPPGAGLPSVGLSLTAGCNAGEYTFPNSPSYPRGPSSTTIVPTAANNWTFGSKDDGDYLNTGWDLYQTNSPGLRQLTLGVTHIPGDGIGFTLAYCTCSALVGNSLDSRNGNNRTLYDINPVNGVASNPRTIGASWDLAFSPMSPEGVLYALVQNPGTPASNALFTVNPTTGAAKEIASLAPLVLNGSAFAADPTTGTLYFIDGNAFLYTVTSGGVVSKIGRVPGSVQIAAMAFDGSGDLFVVDTGIPPDELRQVDKTSAAVIHSVPLSGHLHQTGFAALAINPWSGVGYYSEGGLLYMLDLSNGNLSSPVPITGAEDFGNLQSLTFTLGACGSNGPIL